MKRTWSTPARYLALVFVIAFILVVGWYARAMFQPLIVAGLIAYILNPAVNWFRNRAHFSKGLAVNLVYFLSIGIILAIPATLVPILLSQFQDLTVELTDLSTRLQSMLSQPIVLAGYSLHLETLLPRIGQVINNLVTIVPENALKVLESTSRNAAWALVIIVVVYYLLNDWDRIREWFMRQVPEPYRKDARRLFLQIKKVWAGYLRGQIALMAFLALIYTAAWLIIGLPGAVIIGLLTGLFNIVPELGPFMAGMLAVVIGLFEGSNYFPAMNHLWYAVLILGVYLALNYFKTVYLQPRILGRNVELHEGLVFVAIIVALMVSGILGVLIIVPGIASIIIIGRYLRARILGQPPFQPRRPIIRPPKETPMKKNLRPVKVPRLPKRKD